MRCMRAHTRALPKQWGSCSHGARTVWAPAPYCPQVAPHAAPAWPRTVIATLHHHHHHHHHHAAPARAVFCMHNRQRVEVFCYALSPSDGSQWRKRIEEGVEHFIDASSWGTGEVRALHTRTRARHSAYRAPCVCVCGSLLASGVCRGTKTAPNHAPGSGTRARPSATTSAPPCLHVLSDRCPHQRRWHLRGHQPQRLHARRAQRSVCAAASARAGDATAAALGRG